MDVTAIITSIDAEIQKLQDARRTLILLYPEVSRKTLAKRRGRPPGSGKRKAAMTPEGRQRIAEAMKRRWAMKNQEGYTGEQHGEAA